MMDEGQDRVRATYGGNYDRLAEVKAQYDPTTCSGSTRTSSRPGDPNRARRSRVEVSGAQRMPRADCRTTSGCPWRHLSEIESDPLITTSPRRSSRWIWPRRHVASSSSGQQFRWPADEIQKEKAMPFVNVKVVGGSFLGDAEAGHRAPCD